MTFENVSLTFEQGRIVSATGTPQDKLIKRLDTDEGARYLGEFSFGVNPSITYPMKDILYDEKIAGSVHLTPGNAYEDYSDNGNRSAVHWDLVLIQTAECGLDWFFNGGSLDETDVRTGAEENRLVVEVEFSGITELDRERLGKYAIPGNDTLSIWKSWEDRREKLYGRGRACPDFLEIRAGSTATDRRRLYNDLRTTNPAFDDLPTVTSDAQVQAQLDQWEASHPEQLQDVDIDSTTHLFGFAGQAVMSGLFDYVMVTADLRAGEQTQDARGAILGRILEQAVDRSGADTDLALLAERTRTEQ